jgi:hypothetical protein
MDHEERAKRRLRATNALNEAEANLGLAKERLAKAEKDAEELTTYETSKALAIGEARKKALSATLADRVAAVEELNGIEADAVRNDAVAHKLRCEIGTAKSEHEKAFHEHRHALHAFEHAIGADASDVPPANGAAEIAAS